ncbi:MAG: hypothetical protein VW268_15390 [Rhodospirillaceae bacterium]
MVNVVGVEAKTRHLVGEGARTRLKNAPLPQRKTVELQPLRAAGADNALKRAGTRRPEPPFKKPSSISELTKFVRQYWWVGTRSG